MATLQSQNIQNRANQVFSQWLKTSTGTEKNPSISKTEAEALIQKTEKLGKGDVAAIKQALLTELGANAFTVRADARELFLKFFKIPPESIPVSSTTRSTVNSAQATRISNETDKRVQVSAKDIKGLVENAPAVPANLRPMIGDGLMRAVQTGAFKMDHDTRTSMTRFLAKFGVESAGNAARGVMAEVVNGMEGNSGLSALDRALSMGARPMSYAQYVMAHGGSFEEILFAFLLELADKTDKKLMDKIQEMQRKEQMQKTGGLAANATADARIKALLGGDAGAEAPGAGAPAVDAAGGGGVRKVSTQLEGMVQSVHAMVQDNSVGGVAITKDEASRLVERLKGLPANVQGLLAGSIATAMGRSTMQMQPEARAALTEWGHSVKGKKAFDAAVKNAGKAEKPDHGPLAAGLAASPKLEDKLAAFMVDTLTSDSMTLKDKFKPFKEFRAQIDAELGAAPGAATAQVAAGAAEAAAPEAKASGKKGKKGADADVAALANVTGLNAGAAAGAAGAAGIVEQAGAEQAPLNAQDMGTSDTHDQNEMQRLMQERNRVFEMLSNMMKAMQDMIMTSVRNMR